MTPCRDEPEARQRDQELDADAHSAGPAMHCTLREKRRRCDIDALMLREPQLTGRLNATAPSAHEERRR